MLLVGQAADNFRSSPTVGFGLYSLPSDGVSYKQEIYLSCSLFRAQTALLLVAMRRVGSQNLPRDLFLVATVVRVQLHSGKQDAMVYFSWMPRHNESTMKRVSVPTLFKIAPRSTIGMFQCSHHLAKRELRHRNPQASDAYVARNAYRM